MQTESDLFSYYGMKLIVNVDIAHVLHRTALHTSKAWNPGNKKKGTQQIKWNSHNFCS